MHQRLLSEYTDLLSRRAAERNMSVDEFLTELVNNSTQALHTLQIAEMVSGYLHVGEINQELAAEGLLDIDGDTSW